MKKFLFFAAALTAVILGAYFFINLKSNGETKPCAGNNIAVEMNLEKLFSGDILGHFHFRNIGTNPCVLSDYPQVRITGSSNYLGEIEYSFPSNPLSLAINHQTTAHATIRWKNWCHPIPDSYSISVKINGGDPMPVPLVDELGYPFKDMPECKDIQKHSEFKVGPYVLDEWSRQ